MHKRNNFSKKVSPQQKTKFYIFNKDPFKKLLKAPILGNKCGIQYQNFKSTNILGRSQFQCYRSINVQFYGRCDRVDSNHSMRMKDFGGNRPITIIEKPNQAVSSLILTIIQTVGFKCPFQRCIQYFQEWKGLLKIKMIKNVYYATMVVCGNWKFMVLT